MKPRVATIVDHAWAEASRLRMPTLLVGHMVLGVIKFGQVKTDFNPESLRQRLVDGTAAAGLLRPADDLLKLARDASPEEFAAAVLGRRYVPAKPSKSPSVSVSQERSSPLGDDKSGSARTEVLETALEALNSLRGLDTVKAVVHELVQLHRLNTSRSAHSLPAVPVGLHLVFSGNPGTGKTTVARIMGDIYYGLGLLSSQRLIEVQRSDLVAGYVGQTGPKVADAVTRAMGGVLFIDEAYALTSHSDGDFGGEAVSTLVKLMEEHRDRLAVIVAGYPDEMQQFVNSNAGLRSRFQRFIAFPDYTTTELVDIFSELAARYQITVGPDVEGRVHGVLSTQSREGPSGNARQVRNIFETAYARMAVRVGELAYPGQSISAFDATDIPEVLARPAVAATGYI